MRRTSLALFLAMSLGLTACHHKPKGGPPPAAPAPPPAVPAAPPPAPPPATPGAPIVDDYERLRQTASDEIEKMGLLADIHFDYDKAELRDGDRQILARNAETLKKFDFLKITVEGHCDERGSVEYNLALGERRTKAAHDYLASLGVAPDRMKTVSYGKEVPICQDSTEECWARNRRDHFAVTGKTRGR
ncbi:MAG: peptidoglycan-associated lipoprotein Pal [Acidobacteria bacterium]|nr:MAG: peptidoglycan-associated lipoprotein Pal [Acidobacteriota bacterium]